MSKRFLCAMLAAVMFLGIITMAPIPVKAVTELHMSQAGIDMIKKFEGYLPTPVKDNGQMSVGWGTACTQEEIDYYNKYQNGMITEEQAEKKLKDFVATFDGYVNKFANRHNIQFTQNEFDALVSLTYNVGGSWTNTSNTSGTLPQALISGDRNYILYAFGIYCRSGGTTSSGHIKRRMLEAQIYLYGIYDYNTERPSNLRHVYLDGNGGTSRYDTHAFDINFPTNVIRDNFSAVPTGVGENGETFTYEFAGWFTERVGGRQITLLDHNLYNGMKLYAHWKNPNTGEVEALNTWGNDVDVRVKVTSSSAELYEGPGKFYTTVRTPKVNEILHVTKTFTGQDKYLWGYTQDGWLRLTYTNYNAVINSGTTADGTWGTVNVNTSLNIRKEPDQDATKVGKLYDEDRVLVSETKVNESDGYTWGKIGEDQWVNLQYVILDKDVDHLAGGITVKSIEFNKMPTTLQFSKGFGGITPTLTDGKLKLTYSDGSTKNISMTRFMVSGFDDIELGKKTLTVTCAGLTLNYDVEIVEPEFTGVVVAAKPQKTEYIRKVESLDLSGSRLKLQYSPSGIDFVDITPEMVTGFDNSTAGANTLTVTYQGKTTTFDVLIVPPEVVGISVTTAPTKLSYYQSLEELDVTGGKVTVDYGIAGTEVIDLTADMVTGFDGTTLGTQTLTVTFGGKTTTFPVEVVRPEIKSIAVSTAPDKLEYVQNSGDLDVTGGKVTVTYINDMTETVDLTAEMVTGFSCATLGTQTLTVTYKEKTTTFTVKVIKATVQFLNYDGSLISSNQYAYGDTVLVPEDPIREPDQYGMYRFVSWDREITVCNGDATYTAVFELAFAPGDINCDNTIDEDDAIYLLRHVVFPEKYPVAVWTDIDRNGVTDEADAIYLLRHVVFPEKYPLNITE